MDARSRSVYALVAAKKERNFYFCGLAFFDRKTPPSRKKTALTCMGTYVAARGRAPARAPAGLPGRAGGHFAHAAPAPAFGARKFRAAPPDARALRKKQRPAKNDSGRERGKSPPKTAHKRTNDGKSKSKSREIKEKDALRIEVGERRETAGLGHFAPRVPRFAAVARGRARGWGWG